MNKQELIDKLKRHLTVMSEVEGSEYDKGYKHATKQHLAMIAELDEPEKPVVPQFVSDWLEVCKDNLALSLASSMNPIVLRTNNQPEETIHWFKSAKNQETFAKAWLYSYKVEKEKLYTVEIPNTNGFVRLVLCKDCDGKLFVATSSGGVFWQKFEKCKLTESEIKQDFGWAWPFAEEVEE